MKRTKKVVERLCEAYGTYDPYGLCECLGILIERIGLTDRIRGICCADNNGMAIGLSDNLPEHIEKFVCAHELAHLVLHKEINSVFMETQTLLLDCKYERQANLFAMLLLYPDINELLSYGDTLSLISTAIGLSEELVSLRLENSI